MQSYKKNAYLCGIMKRLVLTIAVLLTAAFAANAQWFDFSSNSGRFEGGINIGAAGTTTPRSGFAMGANLMYAGFYLDFIHKSPEHHYANSVEDQKWNDSSAIEINAGYQIPVLSWLRIMPLVGYSQTNEGITDGTRAVWGGDDGLDWYHPYEVTKGTREHRFNFGGGISVQPCRWFSINLIYTRYAIYGGVGLNLWEFARR